MAGEISESGQEMGGGRSRSPPGVDVGETGQVGLLV